MMNKSRPIGIGFVGLSKQARTAYEMALAARRDGMFQLVQSGEAAQIVLVDADGVGVANGWHDYQIRHPGCLSIAVTALRENIAGHLVTLQKPVRTEDFFAALQKAAKVLHAHKKQRQTGSAQTGAAHDSGPQSAAGAALTKTVASDRHHARGSRSADVTSAPSVPAASKKSGHGDDTQRRVKQPGLATMTYPHDAGRENGRLANLTSPAIRPQSAVATASVPVATGGTAVAPPARLEPVPPAKPSSLSGEPDTQTITLRLRPTRAAVSIRPNGEKAEALDPAWWQKLSMRCDNRLLGHLRQAINKAATSGRDCTLLYRGERLLSVSKAGELIKLYENEALMESLAALAIPADAVTFEMDIEYGADGQAVQPCEQVLWKMGAWTYRGHFPAELDPQMPYLLRRWPNLTRLPAAPSAMRLSAWFVRQPMTISHAAARLGIVPQEVVAFCACASSAGLLVMAKPTGDLAVSPKGQTLSSAPDRSLLRKFAGYLRRMMT